jgi:hypothetical protein
MPSRRDRLPAGTRSASQRAVQKVFDNELALAQLRGADAVRRKVRAVLERETTTAEVAGAAVEVVPVAAVEQALVPGRATDDTTT